MAKKATTEKEPKPNYRTAKIAIAPSRAQRRQLLALMRASRWVYNRLIECLEIARSPNFSPIHPDGRPVLHCWLSSKPKDGSEVEGVPFSRYRPLDFTPWDVIKASAEIEPFDPTVQSKYGVSAKTACAITQAFRGKIQAYFTHRKKGNFSARLPSRFVSGERVKVWEINKNEIRWNGDNLILGSKTQIGGTFTVRSPGLAPFVGGEINAAKVSCDDAGQFWLHISHAVEIKPLDLPYKAGIDMGQKRAMTITVETGKSITITGKDINLIKRRRDRRNREIARLRARVFRAHVRQFLTPEERETMAALEAKSCGSGTKYARGLVTKRRQELGMRRRSRRDWKLLQAKRAMSAIEKRRLSYSNHCITRGATRFLVANKVGVVLVGDVRSIPKRRKKGNNRRKQVKRNALWEAPTQIKQLSEKLELHGAALQTVPEAYSSQTCPNCGARHKPRGRVYKCRSCGWTGDRDGVGAANILAFATQTRVIPRLPKPLAIAPATNRKTAGRTLARHSPKPLGGPPRLGSGLPESADISPRLSGREPVATAAGQVKKSARKPCLARKTAVSATKKVRETRETLATTATPAVEGLHNDLANTQPKPIERRSARSTAETFVQLALWDAGGAIG